MTPLRTHEFRPPWAGFLSSGRGATDITFIMCVMDVMSEQQTRQPDFTSANEQRKRTP